MKSFRSAIPRIAVPLLVAAPAQASERLELMPDPWVLGVLLVGFVVLIAPLNGLIFKPLFRVLDERDDRIAGARRRADRLEREATQVLERYEEAVRGAREQSLAARRTRLDDARTDQASITKDAKDRAEIQIASARGEILAALDEARGGLQQTAGELAGIAAERILGRSLN